MALNYRLYVWYIAAVLYVTVTSAQPKVRVLLDELASVSAVCELASANGFCLKDVEKELPALKTDKKKLVFGVVDGTLVVNGKRYKKQCVEVYSRNAGHVAYKDRFYHGAMRVIAVNNTLLLVNVVDLEAYVCSVLKTESWPSWPLEVHKVQATATRSYAVYHMHKKSKDKYYDLKSTKEHQTYSGIHSDEVLHQAVRDTRGIILTYKNKPALAMFDSCCGSVIPAKMKGINFSDAPYLKRHHACDFCRHAKLYRWKNQIQLDEFMQRLAHLKMPFTQVDDIQIRSDGAGVVQSVLVKQRGRRRQYSISGRELYGTFKDKIKSFCYTMTLKRNGDISMIHIEGKGLGHNGGLCQWGAHGQVKLGKGWKEILHFYYPGTELSVTTRDMFATTA